MLRTAQPPRPALKGLLAGAALIVALIVVLPGVAQAAKADTVPQGKVDVCRYIGTPGDAVLQSGNNPISVSVNAIKANPNDPDFVVIHDPVQVGDVFADLQGFSIVVAVAGDPRATIEDCPG